jgi:hypothetical protein
LPANPNRLLGPFRPLCPYYSMAGACCPQCRCAGRSAFLAWRSGSTSARTPAALKPLSPNLSPAHLALPSPQTSRKECFLSRSFCVRVRREQKQAHAAYISPSLPANHGSKWWRRHALRATCTPLSSLSLVSRSPQGTQAPHFIRIREDYARIHNNFPGNVPRD